MEEAMINYLEIVIRNHEKKFNKNNYDGELFRSSPYRFIKGEGNIIISASHSVNHYRQGTTKVADMLTGAFALYLHEVTSCHVFLRTYNDQKDPNFDDVESDGGYKRALEGIIKEYDIDCLVDLHASAESRPFDIDIGTDYSRTLNGFDIIPEIVKKISEKNEIDVVTHNKVFAAPPNTVTNYISQANQIPCIQLEINRRFRDFDKLDNMSKMLNTLSEFTMFIEKWTRCIK